MIAFLAVLGAAILLCDPCLGSTLCAAGSNMPISEADSPRRVAVPHDAVPGYVVTSVAFLGQLLELKHYCSATNITGRFDVLPNGDVILLAAVSDLIGKDVRLFIRSVLETESWIDAFVLRIGNGNRMVRFPHQSYHGHLPENSPPMTVIRGLEDLRAQIPDASRVSLRYAIIDGPAEIFELETGRGRVVLIKSRVPLDYEIQSQYMLLVAAGVRGGLWEPAITRLWIHVDNVNDNAPVMDSPSYHIVVFRKHSPARRNLITVSATDDDKDAVIYRIAKHEQHFGIHRKNGSIFLRRSGHRLTQDQYELHVFAVDSGGKRSTPSAVHVDVVGRGVRRRTPERVQVRSLKWIEIPESMIGDVLDLDNEYYEVFALKEPAPKFLEVQPMTGTVSLRQGEKFDYETQQEINFTVLITRADDTDCKFLSSKLAHNYTAVP